MSSQACCLFLYQQVTTHPGKDQPVLVIRMDFPAIRQDIFIIRKNKLPETRPRVINTRKQCLREID